MSDVPPLPAWANTLQRRVGQRGIDFFSLHGPGVRDLHPLGARRFGTIADCLAQVILNDRSAIVTYDRGAGIGFSDRDVENDFKTVLKAYDKLGGTNLAQVQPRDPDRALQLIETYLRYQLSGNPRFSAAVIIDYGETVRPAGAAARPEKANYSLTAQADRIAAVLDSLHVRNALVLAHSIGGSEAFRLSYRRPDLVRGLLSIEGGPTERAITPAFKRALRFAPWIKLFGGIRLIRRKIRGMLIDSSGDPSWATDSTVLGYTAAAGRNLDATLKAYLAMANAREPELLAPHLSQIRCPVRLMVGGAHHDGDVGVSEVQLLARTLPAFVIDSVPAAGHFIQEEEPGAVLASVARLKTSVTAAHAAGSQ